MSEIRLQALRATVRISAPDDALDLLRLSLPGLLADANDTSGSSTDDATDPVIVWTATGEGEWLVALGEGGSTAGASTSLALAETITEINRHAARSVAADHVIVHAGSFRVGGHTVAVTGASGAGKSTLVAAAALRALPYVGDEVCAIDPATREVLPFLRPIGLREGGAAAIGVTIPEHPFDPYREVYPWQPPDATHDHGLAPLRLIALVERRTGPVEIAPVRPAEALVRLTELSLAASQIEREAFRRLDHLVRDVPMVMIAHDDAFAAVDALVSYVDQPESG